MTKEEFEKFEQIDFENNREEEQALEAAGWYRLDCHHPWYNYHTGANDGCMRTVVSTVSPGPYGNTWFWKEGDAVAPRACANRSVFVTGGGYWIEI